MATNESRVLVLGAEGTGKTLLLKRIQSLAENGSDHYKEFESVPSTVSTIGTNIAVAMLNKRKISLRELGGAMAPIWKNYFDETHAVVFIIDVSNNIQVSASTILFYDVLGSESLSGVPVLLLLNKTDLNSTLTLQELKFILRLNDLKKHISHNLTVVESSLKSGMCVQDIKEWLQLV